MHLSPDIPIAGILAPLFAIRSEHDLGIGDTRSLRDFVDWAQEIGFRLVQLLPINETGNDNSPYNAISSIALEPTTITTTPDDLPDLSVDDYQAVLQRVDLVELQRGPVNYSVVKPIKRALLERAFARFEEAPSAGALNRIAAFEQWRTGQLGWLEGYSLFRTLMDENGGSEVWDRWPLEMQTLASARVWLDAREPEERARLERRRRFFEYVQWIAFTQWQELKTYCQETGVALMGDVPIGVSYYGADVFASPEIFDMQWFGGAPPEKVFKSDPFTEKWGQNWGVPMYRWDVLEETGYAWWRQRVHCVREVFHLFRIDHVLGFYRMYGFPWRPERNGEFLPLTGSEAAERTGGRLPRFIPRDDSTPENRDANRVAGERSLKELVREVGEYRLIGEDLGVVPDYVRPSLTSLGIAGFKIPQWERRPDWHLIPGGEYQRLSVATYATHDHLPLAALWQELCEAAEHGDGHQRWELEQLATFAGLENRSPQPFSSEVHEALLGALFASNSWLAVVMVTDLFSSTRRFNVPGAVADSNWSERLNRTITQWRKEKTVVQKMKRISELIMRSGRA